MLDAKLWHNKTETKNEKDAEMVEFIKTCDQYPYRLNFGNFFNSIIFHHSFCWGENKSSENALRKEWVIYFCLGVMIKTWRVLLGGRSKNKQIQFFDFWFPYVLPVILSP